MTSDHLPAPSKLPSAEYRQTCPECFGVASITARVCSECGEPLGSGLA